MKPLSGVDGAFLHLETPETPMHVASLHRFELPAGYRGEFHARVQRQIASRLHAAPIFTRKLAPMLANVLFDVTPRARRVPRGRVSPAEHPGMADLAAAALKHDAGQYIKLLRHLPEVVRTLTGLFGSASSRLGQNFSFGPKTPLNVPLTGERGFAALSIPMATLKTVAADHDATVNDVVLALCSGALRRYLAHHGGIPRKPLIATMPISLRNAGNADYTTQAMLSLVNLNTHVADPVKRLLAIRDAAGAMKAMARSARSAVPILT